MTDKELVDIIRERFEYRNDGRLIFTKKVGRRNAGDVAGNASNMYRRVGVCGKVLPEHRVIWMLINGVIPRNLEVDHINHNPHDNRIENLRLVTSKQNSQNEKLSKNNTSGHKGVYYITNSQKRNKRWWAAIMQDRKMISIGYFDTKEEAIEARINKEKELKWVNHIH